ncbi:hypothetical protein GCM10007863_37950 [Dyella mobilis]|nr:hypothetical protein GCM10007863_37950 [Dyella mobilis]
MLALLIIAGGAWVEPVFAANQDASAQSAMHTQAAYEVEQMSFPGGMSGVVLAGTLTRPISSGPTPAVVLIAGSGKTDRDESAYGHKPFLVLADALTRAGYAVLRYDKRGVGQSTGNGRAATTLDFKTDAEAAVHYLGGRTDIDKTRIAVVGHSEGGTIAALMSGDPSPPAAAVSLAGMIAPFAEQIVTQEILTGRDAGADEAYDREVRAYYAKVEAAARVDDDPQRFARMQAISAAWNSEFSKDAADRNAAAESLLAMPKFLASRWFQTYLKLDVPKAIEQGEIPVLFLNGSTDHQVAAGPNLTLARLALGRETPLRHTQRLPGLNHLFQQSASGSGEDYAKNTPTPSPLAIGAVIQFLNLALTKQ